MDAPKSSLSRLIDTLEEDRRRIARDLHDGLGQRLTALRLQLERLQQRLGEQPELRGALTSCDEIRAEMHRVIYDLQPPELGHSSLGDILRDQSEQFELRTGIATSFRASGDEIKNQDVASALLRILQEAMNNAYRHGQAHEVGIVLVTFNGISTLEIADDGRGFDPPSALRGHGLKSMGERVEFFGGTLEVKSSPGNGSTIRVRIPIPESFA